jgi:hypothetical protein
MHGFIHFTVSLSGILYCNNNEDENEKRNNESEGRIQTTHSRLT